MSQYGWKTCSQRLRTQVESFSRALAEILGTNLAGIYLHGSLAMGCFNPKRSDVDLLVVTRQGMDVKIKRQVIELLLVHSNAPAPVEISFVSERQLKQWQHPSPYDLHWGEWKRTKYEEELASRAWRGWRTDIERDHDLAANIMTARERGICLHGRPQKEVFPEIPRGHFLASILNDRRWARKKMQQDMRESVYLVLNTCRAYLFCSEGRISSKQEAGSWALAVLPQKFRPVISHALAVYGGEDDKGYPDSSAAVEFLTFVQRTIGPFFDGYQSRRDASAHP